ncbi:hypothetical protein D4R49_01475 [bacterium]|nr:MAG: hypothetical protein D4R49_01475 [bacterium]
MQTLTLEPRFTHPACPSCGNVFPIERITAGRSSSEAIGHCAFCKAATQILLPEKHKKLVYLDQSFISDAWDAMHSGSTNSLEHQIFTRLAALRERQNILIVVSDIHSLETSAIPDSAKRSGVWEFANHLSTGNIAGTWDDIYLLQQRRVLADLGTAEGFPLSDIGLDDPFRIRIGIQVIPTNRWRPSLAASTAQPKLQVVEQFQNILNSQEGSLGSGSTSADCLVLVRELWCKQLLEGISALKSRQTAVRRFEAASQSSADLRAAIAELMEAPTSPFLRIINQVVSDLAETALDQLHDLLLIDPTGGCACVRLMTAFEAEMLWAWYKGHGKTITNPDNLNQKYGRSRLNDFAHVSTFLPYVDVLTTDNAMVNFCRREVASKEVAAFQAKLYSKKSYPDFERWLDDLSVTQSTQ